MQQFAFLDAAETFTADPSDTNELATSRVSFEHGGTLLFEVLPAGVVGKVVDQIFDLEALILRAVADSAGG